MNAQQLSSGLSAMSEEVLRFYAAQQRSPARFAQPLESAFRDSRGCRRLARAQGSLLSAVALCLNIPLLLWLVDRTGLAPVLAAIGDWPMDGIAAAVAALAALIAAGVTGWLRVRRLMQRERGRFLERCRGASAPRR